MNANTKNVMNLIKDTLGATWAKRYIGSASMFLAEIETPAKKGYWIESTQFQCSDGSLLEREYALKGITDGCAVKVKEFKSKSDALEFFHNMEIFPTGALILERSLVNRGIFDAQVSMDRLERVYDDGLSALYESPLKDGFITYCEGDLVAFHCLNSTTHNLEINRHVTFFNEQ